MKSADRIKERRIIMGYTQEELGEKLGLQKSAIAKYENGRVENIKKSVITNMAEVLECSPCYLMGWESECISKSDMPKIMEYYHQLNDIGKLEATKRVEELTNLIRYSKTTNDYLLPNAAHADEDLEDITPELLQAEDAIMNDENF